MSKEKAGCLCDVEFVSTVYPDGQRISAIILTYNFEIDSRTLCDKMFAVQERTIVKAYASDVPEIGRAKNGRYVVLELSDQDEAAKRLERRGEGFDARMYFKKPETRVWQLDDIRGIDGTVCRANENCYIGYKERQPLVDEFIAGEYKGLKYNLFIPKQYDSSKKYPLVLFIEDAGALGEDARITLAQGYGAVIWAAEEEQKKHECFVLAPQFPGPTIANDEFEVSEELETAKCLLDEVVSRYSIDQDRIYGTGQSMGCMSTCELNIRYPELFAACLLVGGQWNPKTMVQCIDKNLWITVSEGDEKAFPINNAVVENMEKAGCRVGRYWWDAKKSQGELNQDIEEALKDGCKIRYSVFKGDSVLPDGVKPHPLRYHENTWRVAYSLSGLRDWLFSNHR